MIWDFDDVTYNSGYTGSYADGVVTQTATGSYVYTLNSVSDAYYGVSLISTNSVTVVFDGVQVDTPVGYWVQEHEWSVYYMLTTGTFEWAVNATPIKSSQADGDGYIRLRSHMNGTNDDYSYIDETGDAAPIAIGPFDTSWYYVNITLALEMTISSVVYDYEFWTAMKTVDIRHTIYLDDSGINIQDDWITVHFHTNWGNATFTIWDNSTGSFVEVGYSSSEGWYQFAKPTVIATHWYWILVNGSHSGSDSTSQSGDPTLTSDSWLWRNFKVTVNPITFSVTDPYVMQNNVSIIVGGTFNLPNTTVQYTVYEDGVITDTGALTIPASGSYYAVRWIKSSVGSTANWTLAMMSDSSNVTFYGWNYILDGNYYQTYSASNVDNSETIYVIDEIDALAVRDAEMWQTIGIIGVIVAAVVVGGVGFKFGQKWNRRKRPRDRTMDAFRQPYMG
jgi:hypothetical protein